MKAIGKVLGLALWVTASWSWAGELTLSLGPGLEQRLSAQELLARPDVQPITLQGDPAYAESMTYHAVPAASLLGGVAPDTPVQMVALDGFVAELDSTPLLRADPSGAQAWLAIEPPGQPWPAMGAERPSAGPFYLIWTQPQLGDIRPEQWPYQVAEIRVTTPLAERYPAMAPAPGAQAQVNQGWAAFQVHCVVCHTVNRQGAATMGPDLNVPFNPTEYWSDDMLRRYIRDPQAVRYWPQARMPGFNEAALRPDELDALLAYLRHMAEHKVAP